MTKKALAITGVVALLGVAGGVAIYTSAASSGSATPGAAATAGIEPTGAPTDSPAASAPTRTAGTPSPTSADPTDVDNPGAPPRSAPAARGPGRPADPTPTRVIRPGGAGAPETSIAADAAGDLPGTVSFKDGLAVEIGKSMPAVQGGLGPGALPGDPYVLIPVTVTNGSKEDVPLDRVVAQARYGDPAFAAAPVYTEQTQDLSGRLAPGKRAKAMYAFALPADQRGNVTISLDIDDAHALALFHGDLS